MTLQLCSSLCLLLVLSGLELEVLVIGPNWLIEMASNKKTQKLAKTGLINAIKTQTTIYCYYLLCGLQSI